LEAVLAKALAVLETARTRERDTALQAGIAREREALLAARERDLAGREIEIVRALAERREAREAEREREAERRERAAERRDDERREAERERERREAERREREAERREREAERREREAREAREREGARALFARELLFLTILPHINRPPPYPQNAPGVPAAGVPAAAAATASAAAASAVSTFIFYPPYSPIRTDKKDEAGGKEPVVATPVVAVEKALVTPAPAPAPAVAKPVVATPAPTPAPTPVPTPTPEPPEVPISLKTLTNLLASFNNIPFFCSKEIEKKLSKIDNIIEEANNDFTTLNTQLRTYKIIIGKDSISIDS
jgi:hypothetical protein